MPGGVLMCVDKRYDVFGGENMRLALGSRIAVVAAACLVGGKGIASVEADAGHKTSLPAVLTSPSPSAYEARIKYSVSQTITKYARVAKDIKPVAIHTHRGVASRRCCILVL